MLVMPAGRGLRTLTANVVVEDRFGARSPAAKVQVEPAWLLGEQAQPGVDAAAAKVVLAGTVSAREVALAVALPMLARVKV